MMQILILRDPRESKAKCSLTPLRGMEGVRFVDYRADRRLEVGERLFLHPDGDELGPADRGLDLLLVDCAWRRVPQLLATVDGTLHARRLPELRTAYPRRSKLFQDPAAGLASVEALFAACALLGVDRPEFLAEYRWRSEFLAANPGLASPVR